VGAETATLNARGTANNGPAHSYFEYWVNGGSNHRATTTRNWPAGASGPFDEVVNGLYAGKTYLFRVCGRDDSNAFYTCAQTRQFTTSAPVQDSVVGSWGFSPHFNGGVDAHSGPAGQNAQGRVSLRWSFATFIGDVTCLRVDGYRATVGAVGHTYESEDAKETLVLTVVDGGPSGTDSIYPDITEGSTSPPSCANASFDSQIDVEDDLTVNDAP
jgi:hypothetical protein